MLSVHDATKMCELLVFGEANRFVHFPLLNTLIVSPQAGQPIISSRYWPCKKKSLTQMSCFLSCSFFHLLIWLNMNVVKIRICSSRPHISNSSYITLCGDNAACIIQFERAFSAATLHKSLIYIFLLQSCQIKSTAVTYLCFICAHCISFL